MSSTFRYEGYTRGHKYEVHQLSFVTTALTALLYTKGLTTVFGVFPAFAATTGQVNEDFYIAKDAGGANPHVVAAGDTVTITRETKPYSIFATPEDTAFVASNDWVKAPIGRVPIAGQITGVSWYNKTIPTSGTIIIGDNRVELSSLDYDHTGGATYENQVTGAATNFANLAVGDYVRAVSGTNITAGNYPVLATNGSDIISLACGDAVGDASDLVLSCDQSITGAAEAVACPASLGHKEITAATDFVGNAFVTVPAGRFLWAGTLSGSGGASGLQVGIEITPTPTSGLTLDVMVIGK